MIALVSHDLNVVSKDFTPDKDQIQMKKKGLIVSLLVLRLQSSQLSLVLFYICVL